MISRDMYNNRLLLDTYDENFYIEEEFEDRPNGAAAKVLIEFFLHKRTARSASLEVFMG